MATASLADILTAQWVRDTFLFGVDLRDPLGNAIPDSLIEESLQAAISQTSLDLDSPLEPSKYLKERHDMSERDRVQWWALYMRKRPLISIDRVELQFGNQELVTLPLAWASIMQFRAGLVHIIPQTASTVDFTPVVIPGLIGASVGWGAVPGWVAVDYTAGCRTIKGDITVLAGDTTATVTFETAEKFLTSEYSCIMELLDPATADASITAYSMDKTPEGFTIQLSRAPTEDLPITWYASDIPESLRKLIGIRAAKTPLAIAGDFVLGIGVQSRSIGLDGLSQSTSTTKRGRGAYGDRLATLEIEEQSLLMQLKKQFMSSFHLAAL